MLPHKPQATSREVRALFPRNKSVPSEGPFSASVFVYGREQPIRAIYLNNEPVIGERRGQISKQRGANQVKAEIITNQGLWSTNSVILWELELGELSHSGKRPQTCIKFELLQVGAGFMEQNT